MLNYESKLHSQERMLLRYKEEVAMETVMLQAMARNRRIFVDLREHRHKDEHHCPRGCGVYNLELYAYGLRLRSFGRFRTLLLSPGIEQLLHLRH